MFPFNRTSLSLSAIVALMTTMLIAPDHLHAQDGAPSQPEVQSFEPIGTNQMVDLFTGDFTYNIPLFNLPGPDGGYPINLAYHSGIQMEQEASWVGLGWNINVGTINRQTRNLPDDFGGSSDDKITIKTDMKPNWTVGAKFGIQPELFGLPLDFAELGVSPSLRLYYNNFKGVGYTLGLGLNLMLGQPEGSFAGNLGYNLTLDSQEGIGNDFNISLSQRIWQAVDDDGFADGRTMGLSASAGTGFNSRTGWKRNLMLGTGADGSRKSRYKAVFMNTIFPIAFDSKSQSYGSALAISNGATSMSIPYEMKGRNASLSFSTGLNLFGFFTKGRFSVDYSISRLATTEAKPYTGIGYMYYQNRTNTDSELHDVSAQNGGLIHKDTRRLGVPYQDFDIYSVTGQGIGHSFRPYRSDISTNAETPVKSTFAGANGGFEYAINVNPLNLRNGIDFGVNYAHSLTSEWSDENENNAQYSAQNGINTSLSGSVYFQNYGERAEDDITQEYGSTVSSEAPVAYALGDDSGFFDIRDQDIEGYNINVNSGRSERKKRSVGIEAFTNQQLLDTDGENLIISEYATRYFDGTGSNNHANLVSFDNVRKHRVKTHVGGYTATNIQGLRYVYGIAAYNEKEKDVSFSVEENSSIENENVIDLDLNGSEIDYKKPETQQFFQSREKSEYAHSYLLTAILGTDYVDVDGVPGPSEGDLGYWVKFNYRRVDSDMKWRSPYEGAAYSRGNEKSYSDGTGRYSYGEKEVWYLATIESKTHIAEFTLQERKDAKEPAQELNSLNDGSGAAGYYLLEKIDIYSKAERYPSGTFNSSATPLKSCHFTYDYSLCQGIDNNSGGSATSPYELANQGGKLTLKKFHFTYEGNDIGSTTPYEFEYNTQVSSQQVSYDRKSVDRWGIYQPESAGVSNGDYPYNSPYLNADLMKERAQLWSMSAINLPSGGRMDIEYESDSYGYVQDEVAMHMYEIVSMDNYATFETNGYKAPRIDHDKNAGASERRVYFELEQPISTTDPDIVEKMRKYIRPGDYLYFKVAINVTKTSDATELVAGYAKVANVAVDPTSNPSGGNDEYLWGYVELEPMKVDGETTNFHPFTEVGARHIKYNHPEVLYDVNAQYAANNGGLSKSDMKEVGGSLLSNAVDFVDLFSDFTKVLTGNSNDKRLSHIELGRSWIRLRTPDKIKFGGGHRVKSVKITDNWADAFLTQGTESSSTYGTVYDYNLYDEVGNLLGSSGVASYEPIIGGDEIPLRKPIPGWEDKNIAAKSEAQTYTEEPGNESLFPSANVGYSKVRVMSLNTSNKIEGTNPNIVNYSGITEHEFYTAKDYPVYQDVTELEADKSFRKSRLIVPALIVNVDRLRMAATQGYYIELNDMHGKAKGGKEIGFTDAGDEVEISSVEYEYSDTESYTWNDAGEKLLTRRLDNNVDILYSDIDPLNTTQSQIASGTLATDIEFIPETRYHESKNISTGFRMNFETFGIIPAFVPVPYFNWSKQRTGTVVTNKIVHKGGIPIKTIAITRGSKVETENLAFDQYTGQPVLTSISNNYNDKVYNYSIKGYDVYEGMGPAYKNIGMIAEGTAISATFADNRQEFDITTDPGLFPGDELLARPVLVSGSTDYSRDKFICHFVQKTSGGDYIFETESAITDTDDYEFMVIRSGRRNLLGADVSSITALKDPTKDRDNTIDCFVNREDPDLNLTFPVLKIDSVLSISAVEIGDKWYKNTRELQEVPIDWFKDDFYNKGMSGVYSGVRNYAYIDDRIQTETMGETDVDLRRDGVMNDVPLFNWNYILATGTGCPENWREVDQVTLKNPSSASIETKNIIGTYSASLYGKSGTEPIAMAGNAKNNEIGFESFEEYANGSLAITDNATTNLNFYTNIDVTGRKVEDRYDIRDGWDIYGYIDQDYDLLSEYNTEAVVRIHFDGFNNSHEERIFRLDLSPTNTLYDHATGVTRIDISSVIADLDVTEYYRRQWRGEIFFEKTIPDYPSGTNFGVAITDDVAHTGSKSMQVTSVNGSDFLQGRLMLIPGEKYQFSGWFSSPENIHLLLNNSSLFYSKMKLEYFDMDGTLVSSEEFEEKDILIGDFIEDWQKFSIDFTAPAGAYYVSIKLPTAHEVFDPEIDDWVQKAYYDDLRIQPLDGGMQCYVYNQENQRLEATLDGNNYATFYYYNDEGQLFLVKRETEEGVITVQESRAYMKRN